jgi:hypothetical protein
VCRRGGRGIAGVAGSGHGAHRGPPASRHHGALAIPDGVRPTGIPSPILHPMARPTLLKRVGGCADRSPPLSSWGCRTLDTRHRRVSSAGASILVVLGRNNPSLYTVNGRPFYVHLNGLAIILLKEAMKARIRSRKSSTDVQWPRLSNRRPIMLHQSSMWFRQLACCGVDRHRRRWLTSRKNAARVDIDGTIPHFSFSPSILCDAPCAGAQPHQGL